MNNNTSKPGNMLINGDFRVSNKIISAPNEIMKTIKYEKNLLFWVCLSNSVLLSVFLIADNSDFSLFSLIGCFIFWSLDLSSFELSLSSFSLVAISSFICLGSSIGSSFL